MSLVEGLFSDEDVIRQIDREPLLLLGGWRALLMQLAHPAVAAAVAAHSSFERDPLGRLRHTVIASSMIVFGTVAQARETVETLQAVHEPVRGPGYHASDPELILWVHATLVDTALCVHSQFFRPVPRERVEDYYVQSMTVAEVLGVPRDLQPANFEAFSGYMRHMVHTLEVTETARLLGRRVLHPDVCVAAEPGFELARQLTSGLLPPRLRREYGLDWGWSRQLALRVMAMGSRAVVPRLPRAVRRAPVLLFA